MKENLTKIIQLAKSGNISSVRSELRNVIGQKVVAKIQDHKSQVANNYFNKPSKEE